MKFRTTNITIIVYFQNRALPKNIVSLKQ